MSASRKFGAFGGVFTPSILTILGVIMYLRLGWVVGNAGLMGTLVIILAAHIISITTGLSISSIATDKKIGAGGVYYVLSRSLGLPIGGAIGITLFIGTALSIALYLIGFAESFNAYFELGISINDLRVAGTLALFAIAVVAMISTAVALKTQFLIMGFIGLSLVSIFFGSAEPGAVHVPFFSRNEDIPWIEIFAVFFPAVTGFTAGIAMSGDLKDPKRSIPSGTLASIAVGFVVYVVLAVFIAYTLDAELLRSDNNILVSMALFGPLVVAGIWGATLSSALGGILGGPRILQAMSLDKITPKIFAKGVRKGNEPLNALILTVVIAQAGILIGELDLIARLVSMFYLAAYGFINLSFFLESWASADFNPSFKVKRWVGFVGFVTTFAIMFQLDALAMVAAFVIIIGIYLWITRKQISLGTGDIWQSVWSSVVKTGLHRMSESEDHVRNWKPNILLFSGASKDRPYLLDFSRWLAGRTGIVTNFDLVKSSSIATPIGQQSVHNEELKRRGIFGRRIEVDNIYKGIETIASTFGFSGIEPNTVLMGWGRHTASPLELAKTTRSLIRLDHNVLFLDYDRNFGFRNKETIDLWWCGLMPNTNLMLDLAKFIMSSQDWNQATLKIFVVDDSETEVSRIETKVQELLDARRVQAEVKIMKRSTEQNAFYQLMKTHSLETDLVLVGVPKLDDEDVPDFVERTNDLVGTIGTTLLVAASSSFQSNEIAIKQVAQKDEKTISTLPPLHVSPEAVTPQVEELDRSLTLAVQILRNDVLKPTSEFYLGMLSQMRDAFSAYFENLEAHSTRNDLEDATNKLLAQVAGLSDKFRKNALPGMGEAHASGIPTYLNATELSVKKLPEFLKRKLNTEDLQPDTADSPEVSALKLRYIKRNKVWGKPKVKVPMQKLADQFYQAEFLFSCHHAFNEYGLSHSESVAEWLKELVRTATEFLGFMVDLRGDMSDERLQQFEQKTMAALNASEQKLAACEADLMHALRTAQRGLANNISATAARLDVQRYMESNIRKHKMRLSKGREKTERIASNWHKNRVLDLLQFEAGAQMAKLSGKSKILLHLLKVHTRLKYFRGIRSSAKLLLSQLEKMASRVAASNGNATGSRPLETDPIKIEEHLFGGSDHYLENFSALLHATQSQLPEFVELRNAEAYDAGSPQQDIELRTIDLELDNIAEHLIESSLMEPLRQKLAEVGNSMNRAQARLFGAVELLEHRAQEELGIDQHSMLENTRKECEQVVAGIDDLAKSFDAEINELGIDLDRSLNIDHIILHASDLQQYVRREQRRRGLEEWTLPLRKKIMAHYDTFRDLVIQRKRDETRTAFKHEFHHLEDPFSQVQDHLAALALPAKLEDELPFHYKQLFRGKHTALGRELLGHQNEMQQALIALERIKAGTPGAIMVIGESHSGRSFFCEHFANNGLSGRIVTVDPPADGHLNANDVTKGFANAMDTSGSIDGMLSKQSAGSVFILNDMERWWLRSADEHGALNEIARIAAEHGTKHFFIWNCTRHSYELMCKYSTLKNALIATIHLAPITQNELRNIVLERHKSTGLGLVLKGRQIDLSRDDVMTAYFRKLHNLSSGNVGLALRLWLNSISHLEDNDLILQQPEKHPFPDIEDHVWKGIIYQFLLHNRLQRQDVFTLFSDHSREQIISTLGNMRRSGLIKETDGGTMLLNEIQRPYIEQWMRSLEILK